MGQDLVLEGSTKKEFPSHFLGALGGGACHFEETRDSRLPGEIAGQEQETDSQGAGGDWPGVNQGTDYLGEDKEKTAHKADSSQRNSATLAAAPSIMARIANPGS